MDMSMNRKPGVVGGFLFSILARWLPKNLRRAEVRGTDSDYPLCFFVDLGGVGECEEVSE
jgi:hypothetical protein